MKDIQLKVLDVLIIITTLVALGAAVALAYNMIGAAPSLRLGQPASEVSGTTVRFSIPATVSNPGPFPIADVRFSIYAEDSSGTLVNYSSTPFTVPAGASGYSAPISLALDLESLARQKFVHLLTSADTISIFAVVAGGMPPFSSTSINASIVFPWSPPMANLSTGSPVVSAYNSTHIRLAVPFSFDNLSDTFPVSGTAAATIVDSFNRTHYASFSIYAPTHSHYNGSAELYIGIPPPSEIEALLFNGTLIDMNATVELTVFNFTIAPAGIRLQIDWGAQLKDLVVGAPTVIPVNLTHSKLEFPFGFTNGNSFITVNGSANASIMQFGVAVAESQSIGIYALPHSPFNSSISLAVPNAAFNLSGLLLRIQIRTGYGTAYTEVAIIA